MNGLALLDGIERSNAMTNSNPDIPLNELVAEKTDGIITEINNIIIPPQKFLARQPVLQTSYPANSGYVTILSITGEGVLELLRLDNVNTDSSFQLTVDGFVSNIGTQYYTGMESGFMDIIDDELFLRTTNNQMESSLGTFQNPTPIYFSKSISIVVSVGTYSLLSRATYSLYK